MKGWTIVSGPSGLRRLACEALQSAGIRHAFTLRPRLPGAEDPLAGLFPGTVVARPRQVHGAAVAAPAGPGPGTEPEEADAVVVDRPGTAAAVATADCVGAILAAPPSPCFAVFHAGWRGVVAGVVQAAAGRLAELSGRPPSEMVLAMGPSARRCCYQVGEDVLEPFVRLLGEDRAGRRPVFGRRDGKPTVEPAGAVEALALRAGLPAASVHDAGICTMCRPDLCWSYRIQGGGAGRMLAAALIPSASP